MNAGFVTIFDKALLVTFCILIRLRGLLYISVPLKFVDALKDRRHILLFYSDAAYAKKIEYQFIKNGLLRSEHCIYATEEEPSLIKEEMATCGIEVEQFLKRNLLHIYQMPDPFDHSQGPLVGAKNNLKMILADSLPPFRIVAMIVPNISTINAMELHLKLEKELHTTFDNFNGSVICPYDITKLERSKSVKWIRGLYGSHHNAIYAPTFDTGGVLSFN